ncbi:MAG: hypothetical protein LBU73_01655 [Helicobacteraceae bacterium]|jgi:hypothetical protein|nr:hypothetical protein [Helicobacteraceae bacterium]
MFEWIRVKHRQKRLADLYEKIAAGSAIGAFFQEGGLISGAFFCLLFARLSFYFDDLYNRGQK